MEFLNSSTTSAKWPTTSPIGKGVSSPDYYQNREIKVKKFDPRGVVTHTPSGHVSVKSNMKSVNYWPQSFPRKQELESKPWYSLSFDEVVEIHCGDELRLEKYGEYNKSFVTKKKHDSSTPMFAFGSAVGRKERVKSSPKRLHSSNQPKQTNKKATSQVENENKSIIPSTSVPASPIKSSAILIEESIRARRMKVTDLEKELVRVNKQLQAIELNARKEYEEVQQSITQYEESEKELKFLKQRSARAIALSKAAIQKLIEKRSTDNSGQKELEKEIKKWEKQYFDQQVNRSNMGKFENALAGEERRDEVRRLVRKGLARFAKQVKVSGTVTRRPKFNK